MKAWRKVWGRTGELKTFLRWKAQFSYKNAAVPILIKKAKVNKTLQKIHETIEKVSLLIFLILQIMLAVFKMRFDDIKGFFKGY